MKKIKVNVPKVQQLVSESSGREVANQFLINGKDFSAFQSYRSIIVLWKNGKTYLDYSKWDYSNITGRYRNQVLGETRRETEKKIKSGEYILADLNNRT